jgi:hypothetical protein
MSDIQWKMDKRTEFAMDQGASTITPLMILRTEKDIEALLARSRALLQPLNLSRISVDVEGLALHLREVLETQLNISLRECGCTASNFAASAGMLVYVFLLFILVGGPSNWTWSHLLSGILFCLSLAVAAKLLSQLRARLKFIRKLESLLRIAQISNQHQIGG